MATGQSVIERSLRLINALGTGESVTGQMQTDTLEALNDMLESWTGTASAIAWATTLTLPVSYEDAVVYNLAVRLAPEFNREAPPTIQAIAVERLAAIRAVKLALT